MKSGFIHNLTAYVEYATMIAEKPMVRALGFHTHPYHV